MLNLFAHASLGLLLFFQGTTTTVLGTVTDSGGAIMTGVAVRVKNVDTGVSQSAVTDGAGQFRVGNLSIGMSARPCSRS